MYSTSTHGSTPGTIAGKQLPELYKKCNEEMCWLCNKNNANAESSFPLLFLKGRKIEQNSISGSAIRTVMSWSGEKYIVIPVCKECREVHESWKKSKDGASRDKINLSIFTSVVLILVTLFFTLNNWNRSYIIGSWSCCIPLAVFMLAELALNIKKVKQTQKRYKEISMNEHPDVKWSQNEDWTIQGKETTEGLILYVLQENS